MRIADLEIVDLQNNPRARKLSRAINLGKHGAISFTKQAIVDLQLQDGQKWTIAIDTNNKQAYLIQSELGNPVRIIEEKKAIFNSSFLVNKLKDVFQLDLPQSLLIGIPEQLSDSEQMVWPIITSSAKKSNDLYDSI